MRIHRDRVEPFLKDHAAILLLLGLFGILYSFTAQSHGMFMWDEAEYASLSRSLSEGKGFTINDSANPLRPPLLPLLGAAIIRTVNGTDDRVLMIPVVLLALLAIGVVYSAVKLQHGQDAALLSAMIIGASPVFWQHTSYFLTEVPFIAFFAGAVLFMHHGLYRDQSLFVYSWAFFGLALLTRYTALLFGPILILMLAGAFLKSRKDSEISGRIFSRSFTLAPLVAVVLIMPWLLRQQLAFGDALIGFRIASGQLQAYLPQFSMVWWTYVAELPFMLTWMGTGLLVMGIGWGIIRRDMLLINCLLTAVFFFVWFSIYRYKEIRLITGVLPFLSIIAAVGGLGVLRPYLPKFKTSVWVTLLGSATLILSYTWIAPNFRLSKTLGYPVLGQALEFVRNNSSPDDVIMGASSPQIYWYASRRAVQFPPHEDLESKLNEVDWVIIVNFERGQPAYPSQLMTKVRRSDVERADARLFYDGRWAVLVVRAKVLSERL